MNDHMDSPCSNLLEKNGTDFLINIYGIQSIILAW